MARFDGLGDSESPDQTVKMWWNNRIYIHGRRWSWRYLTSHSLGSDVQIFTPIYSASTNFLSNYPPQFFFRPIFRNNRIYIHGRSWSWRYLTSHSMGSDVQIFTPICSASTNFLSNYPPQFFFRPIYHCFCDLSCFFLTYIFKNPWKKSVHFQLKWTRCGSSSENNYKVIFSFWSTTKN